VHCRRHAVSRHVRVDLQERLRVAGSAPPIVVTTSRHEMVIQERAQQNGCAAFFWKPVDGYTLTATIASITNP
jgi:FixJ family two-component response regulator